MARNVSRVAAPHSSIFLGARLRAVHLRHPVLQGGMERGLTANDDDDDENVVGWEEKSRKKEPRKKTEQIKR